MSEKTYIIPDVHPEILFDHGQDAQVDIFDAESVAGLIRHAAEYASAPVLPYLRKIFGDLSKVTAGQIEAVGGRGYALRAEVRPDYDAQIPREWYSITSLACFDSWGRDWQDLSSDSDDAITGGRTGGLGEGVDFTADDVRRAGGNSYSTDDDRLTYRLLHLDGARGIRNVSVGRSGISHYATDSDSRLDHDAVAWVPRGAILAHAPRPEGWELIYSVAEGWQYAPADGGLRQSAEGAVNAWADEVTASDLTTLDQYLSGEVYGVCFLVSNVDLDDDDVDPSDYDARIWEDAPEGDLWGLYGPEEADPSRADSVAYWQALEAIESDLSAVARARENERRIHEAHVALVADLDKHDPGTSELLRALWGTRFRHITSHRQISEGLANKGLQLATTASGRPALVRLDEEDAHDD